MDSIEILTAEEIAEVLRLSLSTVKNLCRKGTLPAKKVGGVWRMSRTDLLKYMSSRDGADNQAASHISGIVYSELIRDIRQAADVAAIHEQGELAMRLLVHAQRLETGVGREKEGYTRMIQD